MGVGIILNILVVEHKVVLLYLSAVILQTLNLGDLAKGEAAVLRSPEQWDMAQGTQEARGTPCLAWAGCWPAAARRADAVVASVALKPCRVLLHVAMLPCHVLDLLALSCYGPCPSNVPCQCPRQLCQGTQEGQQSQLVLEPPTPPRACSDNGIRGRDRARMKL